jgi:S-sulfo-L-cysteine synthase (3-phospho-L-serine-dependent)
VASPIAARPETGGFYSSVIEATELPRIIRLADNLYAAAFTLMKLLPARFIIDQAEARGVLTPGTPTPVLETSSGTFGLGLALICRLRGYPLTIVGDAVIDEQLKTRLEMLGARVEIVAENGHPGGIQGARLDRLAELRQEQPGCFTPDQYNNPDNARSYGIVGDLVRNTIGKVDCLVGPVGSGGSTGGLVEDLRAHDDATRLVGVDTHGSVIFGLSAGPRLLRGLGSSIFPGNVCHSRYDEVHWVTAAEAARATRELYRKHGLFMGPTSGASYLAGNWSARKHPEATILALLPDEGHRYHATVYGSNWLATDHPETGSMPEEPVIVEHPREVRDRWALLRWQRRSFSAVLGSEPQR